MKLLLYSDVHISRTSSIMPLGQDNKYTCRQQMIIDTGKYLANLADSEKPDMIINLGDTFDQHTVTSYDIDVASEFFKCFRMLTIPHIVLVGNHEMINDKFNAIKLLSNINNITVISEPASIDANFINKLNNKSDKLEDFKLAFLPYCDYKTLLEYPVGKFLFSHNDIQGSSVRGNFVLPDGISTDTLKNKYTLVFNGHIHKPSIFNNVINVGSVTTHSFSDDETSVPQCYIFDTDTMNLKTYKPNVCPLFRKCEINSIDELDSYVSKLDLQYKYIIHATCPFDIKDAVKEKLTTYSSIIGSRISVKILKNKEEQLLQENTNISANIDIKQSFNSFLDQIDLKFPRSLYNNVLDEIN